MQQIVTEHYITAGVQR